MALDVAALPKAGFSNVSDWRFYLAKSRDLSILGPLNTAKDRVLQVGLNKAGAFNMGMALTDDLAQVIEEVYTCVIAKRKEPTGETKWMWSGPVWTLDETGPNTLAVACVGWYQTLDKQTIKADGENPTLVYDDVDGGMIGMDLIGRANAESVAAGAPVYVTPGLNQGSALRDRNITPGASVKSEIDSLSNIEMGFDHYVDPKTRQWNTYFGQVAGPGTTIYGRGALRKNAIFGYGTFPENVATISRSGDADKMCNQLIVQGRGIKVIAKDDESIVRYGIFEEKESYPDIVDTQFLQAYANAEVAVRGNPHLVKLTNFTPRAWSPVKRDPRFGRDYDIGDIVSLNADAGRLQLWGQAMRLFGATISFGSNGEEKISALQTQFTG